MTPWNSSLLKILYLPFLSCFCSVGRSSGSCPKSFRMIRKSSTQSLYHLKIHLESPCTARSPESFPHLIKIMSIDVNIIYFWPICNQANETAPIDSHWKHHIQWCFKHLKKSLMGWPCQTIILPFSIHILRRNRCGGLR